jgi:hypothetical protein
MADNTTLNSMTGGDIISSDVITTLNGAGIATGEKAQRVKVGWGVDATYNDTNATNPLPVSLANTGANATAVKVDGSAVTQPVSGTVTANIGTSGSLALDATLTGGTAKTKLVDTGGTNVGTIKAASTAVASTDTALAVGLHPTSPLPTGSNVIGALTANQSVNTAQINGVTPLMGNGVTGTGSQRVTLASDNTAISTAGFMSVKIDQTTPGTTNAVTDTKLPASAASADALANPTITQIGADNMVFNGTSWDRQRGMSVATTTGDTGAKVATGNGATQTNVGNKGVQIFIVLGTVSGTTPTCTFKVQGSVDGGTNWYDIPAATTASLTASTNVGITIYPGATVLAGATTTGTTAVASNVLPRSWRMVWTIGGTTPSFTITSITYNYIPN